MKKQEIIIIVNAYLSGALIAPLLLERGFKCMHVTTAFAWSKESYIDTFEPSNFIQTLVVENEGYIDDALKLLSNFNVKKVIAGIESGVRLADKIGHYFNVSLNDFTKTSARRDKYDMQSAIQQAGLRSIAQLKTRHVDEAIAWQKLHKFNKIVVKPLSSSSSENVCYCNNEIEIQSAFKSILDKCNLLGELNTFVLVQEYISGDEYIVNSVSCDGEVFISDVWRGHPQDVSKVSNDICADLIHPTDPVYKILSEYLPSILNALGIVNGPAHSEIRIDCNGPCLIETGARLAGRADFEVVKAVLGVSQLSLFVDLLEGSNVFLQKYKDSFKLPIQYVKYIYFSSEFSGEVINDLDFSIFSEVKSLFSIKVFLKKGKYLERTAKHLGIKRPGFAYLVSNSKEDIERDFIKMRALEVYFYQNILGLGKL